MEPTTPPHDGGNERTTDDGQTMVAEGRAKHLAEQADTTAGTLADAPDKAVSGINDAESAVGVKTTADDYTQAVAAPMPPLPPEVLDTLADAEATAKQQAMALVNGDALGDIPEYMARRGGEELRQWEARVGHTYACMRPEATGCQAGGIEATGKQREVGSRDAVAEMCARNTSEVDGSPHFAQLNADDRGRVVNEATRLADKYDAVDERLAVKILARFVAIHGVIDGSKKGRNHLLRDVPTTLADIDPQVADETDAIVEITHLKGYDEREDSKAVAASVFAEENGHLTIWNNSLKGDYDSIDSLWLSTSWNGDTAEIKTTDFNEGDKLLIRDASVSEYKGEVSLAVTDDTTVSVIEKGDGRSVGNVATYDGQTTQNPTRCTGSGATIGGSVSKDDEADADGNTEATTDTDTTQGQTNLTEFAA